MLVSAAWFLRGKKARALCEGRNLREALGIGGGDLMADSGAFTFARKQQPYPSVEAIAEVYGFMNASKGLHLDLPVAFMSASVGQQTLFGPPRPRPPSVRSLLRKNLALADECRQVFRRVCPGLELVPVAQGRTSPQYAEQVRTLAAAGHGYVAVGGLAFRGPKVIAQILAEAAEAALDADVGLYVLGVGRLHLLAPYVESGAVRSHDCTTPQDDGHRGGVDGRNSFYYWLVDSHLVKLRLDKLLTGELKLPECSCELCKMYGRDILLFGNSSRTRARSFHNVAAFHEHVGRRFGSGK